MNSQNRIFYSQVGTHVNVLIFVKSAVLLKQMSSGFVFIIQVPTSHLIVLAGY